MIWPALSAYRRNLPTARSTYETRSSPNWLRAHTRLHRPPHDTTVAGVCTRLSSRGNHDNDVVVVVQDYDENDDDDDDDDEDEDYDDKHGDGDDELNVEYYNEMSYIHVLCIHIIVLTFT